MTAIPITEPEEFVCLSEHAVVENRGASFGKIHLYSPDGRYQGHMLWTARQITHPHPELSPDLVGRAVRALALSPWRPDYLPAIDPPARVLAPASHRPERIAAVIIVAWWFAIMGIAPFAWPDHTLTDVWFPLDAVVHGIGVFYVLRWCWRRVAADIRSARSRIRTIRDRSFQ